MSSLEGATNAAGGADQQPPYGAADSSSQGDAPKTALRALEGLRVVDIAGTVATGYCGKLFADHGATVIDLEPPVGFATRHLPPFLPAASDPERSALHRWLSAGKHSVVLDPAHATHHMQRALTGAHVLLTDAHDDALARAGLSLPALAAHAPDIVVSSITWFGQDGPYARFAGSDGVVQSLAGMVRGIGLPEGPPLLPTGYQAQVIGGLTAFIGTFAHVFARELGNASGPVRIDTSILEANLCFTEVAGVSGHTLDVVGPRMGVNRFPPTYPLGVFPCRDGWIGITVLTPSQWHAFCRLLDMDDLAHVPRYQSAIGRLECSAEIEPRFVPKLLEWSANELFHRAQGARVPLALVPTMEALFGVDQYVERGAFVDIAHDDGTTMRAPATPFRLYGTPAYAGAAPRLGAHDATVLAGASS